VRPSSSFFFSFSTILLGRSIKENLAKGKKEKNWNEEKKKTSRQLYNFRATRIQHEKK
jgi:hypothetical protein